MFPPVKGYVSQLDDSPTKPGSGIGQGGISSNPSGAAEQVISKGPKGQAHAQVLAQLNDMEMVIGAAGGGKESGTGQAATSTATESDKTAPLPALTPLESVEILSDFSQMLDVLADRFGVKRARRCGNMYLIVANFGSDTGTPETVAAFAHELFFTLDVYNRKTRRNIKARIGIHCDFLPAELAGESQTLKDAWSNMVHFAYKLETITDAALVSDIFYHQTKDKCTYEQASQVVVRGQGAFTTYRLIGMVLAGGDGQSGEANVSVPPKENGVNNGSSLLMQKLVTGGPADASGGGASGASSGGLSGGNANAGGGSSGGGAMASAGGQGHGGSGSAVGVNANAGDAGRADQSDAKSRAKKSRACNVM
ncbi:hypothetical protein BC831DRAFT_58885 [Entophlyctis helioformis]|nr:hypothetical protein BC831DRAFT_58885 [Entophlyctis helioformis]